MVQVFERYLRNLYFNVLFQDPRSNRFWCKKLLSMSLTIRRYSCAIHVLERYLRNLYVIMFIVPRPSSQPTFGARKLFRYFIATHALYKSLNATSGIFIFISIKMASSAVSIHIHKLLVKTNSR